MKHRFVQDDPSRVSTVKHDVQLIERKLAVAEYQTLRAAVGWPEVADEAVARGLAGDLFSVAAELDGHTIGCARVVGDGGIYLYVQDVIVLPPHQGRGIGKCLGDRVRRFGVRSSHDGSPDGRQGRGPLLRKIRLRHTSGGRARDVPPLVVIACGWRSRARRLCSRTRRASVRSIAPRFPSIVVARRLLVVPSGRRCRSG